MRLEALADDLCPHCGVALSDTRHPLKLYCSDACRIGFRCQRDKERRFAARQGKRCECCGLPLGDHRTGRARFCNRACNREWLKRENRKGRKCKKCGRPIDMNRGGTAKYCSVKCYNLGRSMIQHDRAVKGRPDRACKGCGGAISGDVHLQVLYCSRQCKRRTDYLVWTGARQRSAAFRCEAVAAE